MKTLPKPAIEQAADAVLRTYRMPMRSQYVPEWYAVLKDCGLPSTVLVIDFESYFDEQYHMGRSADSLSTIEYVTDSRFEVVCMSHLTMGKQFGLFADHEGRTQCAVGEDAVEQLIRRWQRDYGQNLEGVTVLAQNAAFDGMILARKYGIVPAHCVDLLGLARAWNSRTKNDLDSMCKKWGLPPKGDTEQFCGVSFRQRFTKPKGRKKGPKLPVPRPLITDEQVKAIVTYANNDVMREWEAFTILLAKLSCPKTELQVMQMTLEMFWKPTLTANEAKAADIIVRMEAEIDKVMDEAGVTNDPEDVKGGKTAREKISGDKTFEALLLAALAKAGDNAQRYYKPCKRGYMLALAKDDEARQWLNDHESEQVRNLLAARSALDSWPLHIARVRRIVAQAKANRGRLCVPLKYHGAHTGRDSGGEKINLQNLGSRGHALIAEVREIIEALEGECLVITDASAVEARGTAWIAGQWDLCKQFEAGAEIYCGFASRVLGRTIRKPIKEGKPGYIAAIEKRMTWARNMIGKIGILGCGYGMGTDRIYEYAGRKIDLETAEKIKTEYRAAYPAIVQFWKDIEKSFLYTAEYKRPCEMPRGLKFSSTSDCDVIITLPSGRELHYHTVKLVEGKYGKAIEVYNEMEHKWGHVWGGHLTENVVQAFCRDALMEASIRLKNRGIHTALRVHDELVMPCKKDVAQDVLKASIEEMSKRPLWAPDLPLGAEGTISSCYKK